MKSWKVFLIWIVLFTIKITSVSLIDPLSGLTAIAVGAASIAGFSSYLTCKFHECCNEKYIPQNMKELERNLMNNLFGQNVAEDMIINALHAHIRNPKPRKPLVFSFHGPPGTGKNYVSNMIIDTFLLHKQKSQYFLSFRGRADFMHESNLQMYQEELSKKIRNQLVKCPKSIIIFDEVDKMIPGLLDAVVRYLDYGPMDIDNSQAIFIFLSNKGSNEITNKFRDLWATGQHRSLSKPSDYESIISLEAFNQEGGFYMSDTIKTVLIDHFVPFLPLETTQIKLCIEREFANKNRHAKPDDIREIMEFVKFEPPDFIFAQSGCKSIYAKVQSIIYKKYKY